jgi:sigma-B regulation protein RsbU (phosphoserine phosphatase)
MKRNLILPNDVQDVPRLAAFIDEICESVELDMTTTMQINLAIEEAVVNVMNYAYPPGTYGEVNIEAETNDNCLQFVISDQGKPFDPTLKEEADTTLSAEERQIGGLGIYLVRHIMDHVDYQWTDGRNVLTLKKNLKPKQ